MPPTTSSQPSCSSEEKKKEQGKKADVTIKCKHRGCPEGKELTVFELVPEINQEVAEDEITISWKGNTPPAPPQLNWSEGSPVTGPPYKFPLKFKVKESKELFPELYNQITSGKSKFELTKDALQAFNTLKYKKRISVMGLPWGTFESIVYNPDQWKISVDLPIKNSRKISRGVKFEKDASGASTNTKTWENNTSSSQVKGKRSVEEKQDGMRKLTTTSSSVETTAAGKTTEIKGKTIQSDLIPGKNIQVSGSSKTSKGSPEQYITIEKNGARLDVGALKYIIYVGKVLKWVSVISDAISDIPKAGVYIDWEVSALEGTVALSYGWKEYTDHRAYYAHKVEVDITFIKAKIEFGVGVSGFSFKLQAFVAIDGEVKFNGTLEKNKPEDLSSDSNPSKPSNSGVASKVNEFVYKAGAHASAELSGKIVGSIGVRAEALYIAKIEAKLESGIEVKGNISFFNEKEIFIIESGVIFTGIKGSIEASRGPADAISNESSPDPDKKSYMLRKKEEAELKMNIGIKFSSTSKPNQPKEWVLVEPVTMYRSRFPDDLTKYEETDEVSVEDFKGAIKEMLNGRYHGSGWLSSYKISVKEFMSMEEFEEKSGFTKFIEYGVLGRDPLKDANDDALADIMFNEISKNKLLDLSKKNVELLLLDIRRGLEKELKEYKEHTEKKYIEIDAYKEFVRNKIPNQLIQYVDPYKEWLSNFNIA